MGLTVSTPAYAPQFLAPVRGRLGAAGLSIGMRELTDLLAERSAVDV